MTPERREQAEKEVREKLGWWIERAPDLWNSDWARCYEFNGGVMRAPVAGKEVEAYNLAVSQTIALEEAQERIADLEWEKMSEIPIEESQAPPVKDALSIAADGLAKALRSVDPFSGGRDGDMCLWCRRDRPRDLTEWAERFDPDNHDADCELILVLAAFEKAKESR